MRRALAARLSCSNRAATGGIAGGLRSEATAGRKAAAAALAAAEDEEMMLPSRAVMGRNRGGVCALYASSGASLDGSDCFWNCKAGLILFGWVSTGTGGGIAEGVARGVFVADELGSMVGEVGGAMLRQSLLLRDHCRLTEANHHKCLLVEIDSPCTSEEEGSFCEYARFDMSECAGSLIGSLQVWL